MIKKGKSILCLSAIAVIASTSTMANQLFVSPYGVSDTCSNLQPCNLIQTAIDLATSGDDILIGAGRYHENLTIPPGKSGISLTGQGEDKTRIISSPNTSSPKFAPPGVPADIIIDIFSPNVTIKGVSITHPSGTPTMRDIGIFVRPPALNTTIKKSNIERNRTGNFLEPTTPGSRGILVFRASGTRIMNNEFEGNYQDHLHIPAPNSVIVENEIEDATRAGIVIIQENDSSDSSGNYISYNEVENSGVDGIQIQSDNNFIVFNEVEDSGNTGINLCGIGGCIPPGTNAIASNNVIRGNDIEDSGTNDITDNGINNTVQ